MAAEKAVTAGHATSLRWAGDHNRLLPGERPQTLYSEDAEHWIRVYTDLLAFNQEMLDGIGRRVAGSSAAGKPEGEDYELLKAHVRRLRWRLRFWKRRGALLETGVETPAATRASN